MPIETFVVIDTKTETVLTRLHGSKPEIPSRLIGGTVVADDYVGDKAFVFDEDRRLLHLVDKVEGQRAQTVAMMLAGHELSATARSFLEKTYRLIFGEELAEGAPVRLLKSNSNYAVSASTKPALAR